MERSKNMGVRVLVLLSALGSFGAGCAAPPSGSIELADARVAEGEGRASPAGFDVWLREQCPDGAALRITTEMGAHDTACEAARESLLADDSARLRLVDLYLTQTEQTTAGEPSDERVGEARERGVFSGFACGLLVTGFMNYQCDKIHYPWSSCTAAAVPPSILCALIGWAPFLP